MALRLQLLACEILYREICSVVATSPNRVDVTFLPKGLHDAGQATMNARLQEALDAVDTSECDAVLLAYGLCSNGVVGLAARDVPLVIPRAHDCITLFLGSKERYLEYFQANPGVFFKTTGWIERGESLEQYAAQHEHAISQNHEELVAKYGEDNAAFLYEEFQKMTHNYRQMTFIEMGVEPDGRFLRRSQEQAKEKGWKFDHVQGNLGLVRALVDGPWDEARFLVVEPGQRITTSYDESVVKTEEIDP